MRTAGKFVALALSLGAFAGPSCASGAEPFRADRIVLEVPDGGMTQAGPAQSESIFKHRVLDVTVAADVQGAPYYDHWQRACTPGKGNPDEPEAYQLGTLARADQYLYSKLARFSHFGIFTPKGTWLEYCLIFRSGDLAAKITIDLPKSVLEKGDIAPAAIEKILATARLTAASVEDRNASDPRLVLDMPDDFAPTGLPAFTFGFKHNRLPFSLHVTLSDAKTYDTAKMLNRISARRWTVGSLARTDEYFYYFVWPDSYPSFELGFRAAGGAAQVGVSIGKESLDRGDVTVEAIERMLASARTSPDGDSNTK
jgi:hypothetical protein